MSLPLPPRPAGIAQSPRAARRELQADGRPDRRDRWSRVNRINMDQPIAVGFDQAPAGAAEPRIDTENANRMPGHDPVDSPGPGARLARFAPHSGRLCGPFQPVTMDSRTW